MLTHGNNESHCPCAPLMATSPTLHAHKLICSYDPMLIHAITKNDNASDSNRKSVHHASHGGLPFSTHKINNNILLFIATVADANQ